MKVSPAHAWVQSRRPDIQELQLPTSFRLGPTLIHLLQEMFPNEHQDLQAAATHDTLLLPVVFHELSYFWNTHTNEVQASPGLFTQTLYILAFEFACNRIMRREHSIKILIVGFTLAVIDQFQSSARQNLGELCYEMCVSVGLSGADAAFDNDELVASGVLLFAAAFKSGGFDVDVALVLATRSQRTHVAWQGHVVMRNLIYIALTRASKRVWLFIEDLRREVLAQPVVANEIGVTAVGS